MSPYLFILCNERLSQQIFRAVSSGRWKPATASRNRLQVSHVFFADDLMFFAEASLEQIRIAIEILHRFGLESGQVINWEKSSIFFSKNTPDGVALQVVVISRIPISDSLGTYLGTSIFHGRVSSATYLVLLDKSQAKLCSWKAKSLSLPGRVLLAKSVLSIMPNYIMNSTKISVGICDKIDRIVHGLILGMRLT